MTVEWYGCRVEDCRECAENYCYTCADVDVAGKTAKGPRVYLCAQHMRAHLRAHRVDVLDKVFRDFASAGMKADAAVRRATDEAMAKNQHEVAKQIAEDVDAKFVKGDDDAESDC